MQQIRLNKFIEDVVAKSGRAPHKQKAIIRSLKARLVANEALMDAAFAFCGECSKALLYTKQSHSTASITNPE